MSFLTSFFDKLKSHNYSIVTALVIGIITAVYLLIIVPNNEKNEDANNLAIFKGIEGQLKGYVDDKLKEISPEIRDSIIKKNPELGNDLVFIDKIEMVSLDRVNDARKKLQLIRNIDFKKSSNLKFTKTVTDTVQFDLEEFIKRINVSSNFKSFFICPVMVSNDEKKDGKSWTKDALISQNVSPKVEDSLCLNNKNDGLLIIDKSSKRFYTNQVRIPDTNFTLFFAAGISSSYFQSNVQYIKPNHLIFGLLLISILFLSICFIKPVVMSYKELLSQMDLIRVVFSIGALIAIFVIFGMVGFWKTTISNRNKSDLKQLVHYIDTSFNNQIDTLKYWRKHQFESETLNGFNFPFKKLYLDRDSKISLINGDSVKLGNLTSFMSKIKEENRENKIQVLKANSFNPADSLKQLKFLDVYFWMNEDGLLTASLDKDNIGFPRKFNDRNYFKLLQNKEINSVLTGVFSREFGEYQWIYAEKNIEKNKATGSEKFAIKGIAFREQFSKELKLPPDTDYMLVSRGGFVLAQNNPTKKLYQNVLSGSKGNLILASVLAGCAIEDFQMEYQGNTYQVHAKKLSASTDLPVYILGIRNLSYLDYLSQFTFINAILIVLAYGLFLVLLILGYSSLFYSGRLSFFSREHFYHLFHNYSRKEEYNNLFYFNCICLLMTFIVFLFSSPITALYFCLLIGLNSAFINIIILNRNSNTFKNERIKFYILMFSCSFLLPLIFLYFDQLYISVVFIIISHLVLIVYFRKENIIENTIEIDETDSTEEEKVPAPKNNVVQRKTYLKFITSALMNHFVMFPFILVCASYSNEINDYVRYYCSPPQPPISKTASIKMVNAYGCACESKDVGNLKGNLVRDIGRNNESIIHKLNFGFEEPTRSEVNNYTIKGLYKNFYIRTNVIFCELGPSLFFLILGLVLILFLAYSLLNYYSNQFFFFELMQVSYAGYYPLNKKELDDKQIFIDLVFDAEIKSIDIKNPKHNLSTKKNESETLRIAREDAIRSAFAEDKENEILPIFKQEFILNSNLIWFEKEYLKIWQDITNKHAQNVLYDFAQDYFSNYKNKDILMEFMDLGLINHNEFSGRLQIRSESFRRYIIIKSKEDTEFVAQFKDDSKNGTFDKLKLPIFIIATSLLVLLMYINKDSYEKLAVMGTSIGSAILLVNRFLSVGKS